MKPVWKSKGEKVHSRVIEISTYEYGGERIIVEGTLKDDRFQETHIATGERIPKGVVHHMAVRLLVNCADLLIEDIDLEMIHVPREVCRETQACLAPIKGLHVTKGFTAKVKSLAGGKKGCTHVIELLLAMAPAVIQGYAAHRSAKPGGIDPELAKMHIRMLLNTCHVWREDGPIVGDLKKVLLRK